jgi:hypothetical protein
MICFRDMTFCTFYNECAEGEECHRALTPEVRKRADDWWKDCGGEAPIAHFGNKPECFSDKNIK